MAQPGASFPLERLAQLVRERDGSLDRLVAELEDRSKNSDAYAVLVALAGLHKLEGKLDLAAASYERAIAVRPNDASAVLALARLLGDRGDAAGARARYEKALSLQTARTDREQTLRTLIDLALEQKDYAAAKAFHQELVKLEPTSLFVRAELARELSSRGEYTRAEAELKEVVVSAAGDNRALAPLLKELGQAQARAHESSEALATLQRALGAAGAETALRASIYEIIASIYRADQKLPTLVKQLEDEHASDIPRLSLLGALYEEIGDSARAVETYRRALAANPRQIDLRLRLVRLLQANGDLDRAIAEYEGLIRAAPNNPQFVFEECEALLQRGDRARAEKLVSDLEARAAGDEDVLSRVAEFYTRIGDSPKSLRVLKQLADGATGDAGHLVDLGDRYFQDGNAQLAVATWKRILSVVQPRAKALAALGDVYLEHDLVPEALAAYKEATQLEPANLAHKKALAAAYERAHKYGEARELYEELVKKATGAADKQLARESRKRIVTLWSMERVLEQKLAGLAQRFGATPPDVEAGWMLAEAQTHLRKLPEAELTLRRIVELTPGEVDAYLALEHVLVVQSRMADAISVLERLAQLEPKKARELYERMAQYALQIYKDDDAIRYAARAVELNPDDAEGHRRLGEMYRSKQDVDRAIAEFRAALAKNEHLFLVHFELADLLMSKGLTDDADRLLRAVVRGAPDEELVARAARLSAQINIGRDTLESLEQDLLPLAIGNPQRPIYRRLLVEIYGSLTFGLMQRVRHASAEAARAARESLARIGTRAIKPLLDALADSDVGQQRIAIDVLPYVQNKNAAVPLFAFATGQGDADSRSRAMLACGALADSALVPRYEGLLFAKNGGERLELADSVALAGVWGLAKIGDTHAVALLRRIVRSSGSPPMRALAALGLGLAHDRPSAGTLAEMARAAEAGAVARAAAAYALGELGTDQHVPLLLELAENGDRLPRRTALTALARLAASHRGDTAWKGEAIEAMAAALFSESSEDSPARDLREGVARGGTAALALVATGGGGSWGRAPQTMPPFEGSSLSVERMLDALLPADPPDADRQAALVQFVGPIRKAALAALGTSSEGAVSVLDALGTGEGEFLPFVSAGAAGPAASAARELASALAPSIIPLATHPDVRVRAKALLLVARLPSAAAGDALVAGIEDRDETVQRVALGSARLTPNVDSHTEERIIAAAQAVLAHSENWSMRVLAAQALGRLGEAARDSASASLTKAVLTDRYALVREAALEAFASFNPGAARALAGSVATSDPEARVRRAAERMAR
jgi:tetratricopeptide (TPR) repeat protein